MLSDSVPPNGDLVPYKKRHPNMFHNVTFPTPTYYCPPQPPSQLMGRYCPPPRPGPVYKNDLSLAGPREHEAQKEVSRIWRGIMTRRDLRNAKTAHHMRMRRALMIQCWWRRLSAIWHLRKLKKIVEEWAVERREQYVCDRLSGYGIMMTWQRLRVESAVMLIQRVYRWYVNRRQRQHFRDGDAAPPDALPFPLPHKKKRYFPWRPRAPLTVASAASPTPKKNGSARSGKAGTPRRPRLSLHTVQNSLLHLPPAQEELEEINARMREREAKIAEALAQPEVLDRQQWKRDGLRENEFDHNAGMIQRMVRYKWAGLEKMTLGVTAEYFFKKVFIIQRAFHISRTLRKIEYRRRCVENLAAQKNAAYAKKNLEETVEEMAWQSQLLNNAALTIQKAFAYYKSRKVFRDPFGHFDPEEELSKEDVDNSKPPPPYHLIDKHIEREVALRYAAQSKMERDMQEIQNNLRTAKATFVPARIIVVCADPLTKESPRLSPQRSAGKLSSRSLPFAAFSDTSSVERKVTPSSSELKRKRSIVMLEPGEKRRESGSSPRLKPLVIPA